MLNCPKKTGLIFVLMMIPLTLCSALSDRDFNVNTIFSNTEVYKSLSPREQGSLQESGVFDLLKQQMDNYGISYSEISLEKRDNSFSRSRFIDVSIPGKSQDEMIIVVPIDSGDDPDTARNSAINVALAMEFLRYCSVVHHELTLRVLFLGAERMDRDRLALTSEYYIQRYYSGQNALVLYMDFRGIPGSIRMGISADALTTPLWAMKKVRNTASRYGVNTEIIPARVNTYRTSLNNSPSPLYPYLREEIPAVLLETGERVYRVTPDQKVAVYKLLMVLDSMLNSFPDGLPEKWDRNYLVISFGKTPVIINESIYIFTVILLLTVFVFIVFLQNRKVLLNIKKEIRFSWTIPLFFMIIFVFLFITTLILEFITLYRDFPLMWQQKPYLFLLFKIGFPAFLSFFFLHIIGGLPISRSPHFYSYSAAVFVFIDIIILAVSHPVMMVPYLWAFLWIFFFIMTRKAFLKGFFTVIAFLPGLVWLVQMLSLPSYPLLEMLIVSRINGNILLTFLVMPVIFLIASINNHAYHYNRTRERYGVFLSTGTLGTITVSCAIFLFFFYTPYQHTPQPIEVIQRINSSERQQHIHISSPAPLNDYIVYFRGKPFLETGNTRNNNLELPYNGRLPDYQIERNTFLNRENYTITLYPETNPRKYNITLLSNQNIAIFDSNYPITLKPDGKSAIISTGINPPAPLVLEFTVSRKGALTLELEEVYLDDPYRISVLHQNADIHYQTRFFYSIYLDPER